MPPRFLADVMLGRLARYLRFVGCDTVYLRGASDAELVSRAHHEDRILLTRDRQLSGRSRSAFLIRSPEIAEQWRAVRAAWPTVPTAPSFARCTLCNGPLLERSATAEERAATRLPPSVRDGTAKLYACGSCGHLYWDGSHTGKVRERLAAWEREGPP